MVEWRHYRSFPGSPAIYFAVRFRVTGATPGCFADLDLDFRFQLTQRDRVIPVRWGGGFEYELGRENYNWWLPGNSREGGYHASLPYSGPYRIKWTWAWCWRVPPVTRQQGCEADEP
ncbi:MAG: hypothetical protein OXH75_08195 [Acidobacteria bacterium]|nr:hypothetical protein [Acidobacteriota bacterium]